MIASSTTLGGFSFLYPKRKASKNSEVEETKFKP